MNTTGKAPELKANAPETADKETDATAKATGEAWEVAGQAPEMQSREIVTSADKSGDALDESVQIGSRVWQIIGGYRASKRGRGHTERTR